MIEGIVGALTILSGILTTLRGWRQARDFFVAEISKLRIDFTSEVAALRRDIADMRVQLATLSSEMRDETVALRERMASAETRLEQLEARR